MERAATWNGWTEQERLLQLAGHLRVGPYRSGAYYRMPTSRRWLVPWRPFVVGWNLAAMLGALEFKHRAQQPKEGVCDFITRMEKAFREAYGREPMSKETRDALLFAQLQDGLRYELVRPGCIRCTVL